MGLPARPGVLPGQVTLGPGPGRGEGETGGEQRGVEVEIGVEGEEVAEGGLAVVEIPDEREHAEGGGGGEGEEGLGKEGVGGGAGGGGGLGEGGSPVLCFGGVKDGGGPGEGVGEEGTLDGLGVALGNDDLDVFVVGGVLER